MAEDTTATENTPDGSLESAATAIDGVLARKPETQPPTKTQPEQSAKTDESPAEQAPAAPEAKAPESEQAATSEDSTTAPKLYKVKVGDDELDVPEDELLKGYLRQADYTRKTQEHAQQRREWEEGDLKAAREHRAQQDALLTELKRAIQSVSPQEPNWDTLKLDLPPEQFAAKVLEWNDRKDALAKIDAEQQRLKDEADAEAQKGFASYVTEQRAHLERELPDFKDPEKGAKLQKDLTTFAKTRGFTDEELAQVVDHRVVLLLHDAMQHQQAKAKAPEIKTKIEKAIEAAAPTNTNRPAKKTEKDSAFERAAKSGRPEDAAKFLEHLI